MDNKVKKTLSVFPRSGLTKFSIDIPIDLHKDFKIRCLQNNTSMRDAVTEFIKSYVKK